MSECTALLGWKSVFGVVSDSSFSSVHCANLLFQVQVFLSQHPQVWNLIGTEYSLNRGEHRYRNKAKLRVFPINWRLDFRVISSIWESDYGSQIDVRSHQRLSRQ